MSTYLVLCQDMARDVGIPGTGPSTTTTTDLSEEEASVVRYINQADQDIQSRWFDWNFLWSEADFGLRQILLPLVERLLFHPAILDFRVHLLLVLWVIGN